MLLTDKSYANTTYIVSTLTFLMPQSKIYGIQTPVLYTKYIITYYLQYLMLLMSGRLAFYQR